MAKKFLSALLAVLMIVGMVPMAAMADVAEYEPTLAVGVSESESKAKEDAGKAVGATISSDVGQAKNILWFAMTGLGTGSKYSLSVTNANGDELLGDKYVSYTEPANGQFTGEASGKHWIYVSLDQAAEGGEGAQVNSDALGNGDYTVKLIKVSTGDVIAEQTITLKATPADNNATVWTGTQKTDAGTIEFKKATIEFEGKFPSDYQTGEPQFAVTAAEKDSWNVAVSGATLKYVSDYTGFNASLAQEQHGYYLGISIPKALCGNIVGKMVGTGRDASGKPVDKIWTTAGGDGCVGTIDSAFTEYNKTYCDMVLHLGETVEEVKAKKYTVKLTYGNMPEQTYTFDFSGLNFPSEELKAEAVTGNLTDLDNKSTNDLQADITATANPETKTITVTGTSYYVADWSAFAPTNNTGNFVALKLTNTAGVKMKLYSPTEKDTPREWKDIDADGIIVTRLQNLEDDGYKGKVKVGANAEGGTEWTIDYTGVEMRELGTELQVDALNGTITIGDDSSKKGSDLQSDVTITRKRVDGVVTFAIRGNSSYIPSWDSFSSKSEEKEGNYVALKLTAPEGYANTGIKVSDGTRTVACDASGEVVAILDGRNSNKRTVTVEAEGKDKLTYVLDFSGMKLLPAEILGVTVNSKFANKLEGLAAAYKDGKIHLSGKVEPKESNESLFNDAQLKVNIGAGAGKEKLVTLRFIKSGDTLEVISDPTSIAGNTLEFDTSMLVIKKADATDVATTAAPSASISDTIPEEQKEAAQEVSTALGNSDTQIDEATLQKYANVISNDSTGKGTLVADAAKIVEEHGDKMPIALKEQIEDAAKASADGETNLDVTTVVQTYAKIDVVGVVTSEDGTTSFEISITPMARTIVTTLGNEDVEGGRMKIFDPDSTETNANSKANAIVVNDEEIKIGEPTPVTLVLPDSYKAATAFIKHVKDNGDKYVYEGKITGIAPRKLEFISEHGFSSFTVSAEKPVLDQSSDATLSEVKVGEYTVTKSGNDYTVNVPEGADVTKLPLTLTATDSKVQGITVNGTAYTAGMEIDLTTAAKIVVTAEDGTTAEYTLTAVVGADPQPWTNPYTDVKEGDWFYDAVKYVNQNGLMEGTSANKFSPRSDLTRGMFAQILYNAAGKPSVTWTNKFSDVKEGDWYASAIIWAADQGVLAGYGNGTARPKSSITREDLVSLLWRYEGSPAPTSTTLNFSDASKVSSYAKDAMLWAVENDIVTGTSGKLNPQGNAMRAEAAQMLMKYFSNK